MNKQAVFGGFIFVAIGALIIVFFFYFFGFFSYANPSVQASIVAGGVALGSLLLTVWRDRSRAIREAHREKKIEIYNSLYDTWFSMMDQKDDAGFVVREDTIKNLRSISRNIVFYGSPQVITALSDFNLRRNFDPNDPTSPVKSFGRILLAMRADIGLSNFGLNELSVQQVLITDDLSAKAKS